MRLDGRKVVRLADLVAECGEWPNSGTIRTHAVATNAIAECHRWLSHLQHRRFGSAEKVTRADIPRHSGGWNPFPPFAAAETNKLEAGRSRLLLALNRSMAADGTRMNA